MNVQEKRGAGAVVGMLVGCDWVMMMGGLWARVPRAVVGWGRLLVLFVDEIDIAHVAPVSMIILIAKRTSLLRTGSRLVQCRIELTEESGQIQSR